MACDCDPLVDVCADEEPCPECVPCDGAPRGLVASMLGRMAAAIRCGWPEDRCPPHRVSWGWQPTPVVHDGGEVQIIVESGGAWPSECDGRATIAASVIVLRPWAPMDESGLVDAAAERQRTEVAAQLLDDRLILGALLDGGAQCTTCISPLPHARIDRVGKVQYSRTAGWSASVTITL